MEKKNTHKKATTKKKVKERRLVPFSVGVAALYRQAVAFKALMRMLFAATRSFQYVVRIIFSNTVRETIYSSPKSTSVTRSNGRHEQRSHY